MSAAQVPRPLKPAAETRPAWGMLSQYDPLKLMTYYYDAAVVAKGGKSIFACKPVGEPSIKAERALRNWAYETPHIHAYTPGPRPDGRPSYIQKPGRLVASITGKLDDYEGGV